MARLSDWRAAAWVAFCLAAAAAAAALLVPAAFRDPPSRTPVIHATLTPRTHLFGQPVSATLELPAGSGVKARFAPYRVVRRTTTRHGRTVRYEFALDCLRSRCLARAGGQRELSLPPVLIRLPDGRRLIGIWPRLREASRLGPADLRSPQPRGELAAPAQVGVGGPHRLTALLLAFSAAFALLAGGVLGLRWLAWRPPPFWSQNGRRASPSALEYALLVTRLTAGGSADDRRAALESLAIALDERGLGDLATQARSLAWSPPPPAGESVRRLVGTVRQVSKERA